ncbi:MAG: hypothetical protein IPH59_12335 [bacterium]|nr:hypothetical protein [bacterium]
MTSRVLITILSIVAFSLQSHFQSSARADNSANTITEISGVARLGGRLLLVSDDQPGCYFELKIEDPSASVIPIDPAKLKRVTMKGCEAASDFESITVLGDGRIAVLSEDLHSLFSATKVGGKNWGVLAQFNQTVTEFGNRGLEGAAAFPLPSGASKVAVVWEGGYPAMTSLPEQIQNSLGHSPLQPILIVFDVPRNVTGLFVDDSTSYRVLQTPKLKDAGNKDSAPIPLDSELPKSIEISPQNAPPFAQRYRAPDLVWHFWQEDDVVDTGLIVLLSSENAPLRGSGTKREYKFKDLQRYNLQGKPVGSSIEINALVKPIFESITPTQMAYWSNLMKDHFGKIKVALEEKNWENVNWEGLDWFVRGQSLVLVYDGVPADPPFAVVIPIPDSWK